MTLIPPLARTSLGLFLLAGATGAQAPTQLELQELSAPGGSFDERFGSCAAIDGDTIVVGAPRDDLGSGDTGAAYVFWFDGAAWVQQATLTASDGAPGDWFGSSVDVSGDTVVVGAQYEGNGTVSPGAAYVYTRSGTVWTEQQKVVHSDNGDNQWFGFSAAVDGDRMVVGVPFKGDVGFASGAAYVFVRSGSTWTEEDKLTAADAASGDFFGWCVDISGDTVACGSVFDDDNGDASGSAYFFTRSGAVWSQEDKVVSSDGAASDQFASSIALDGDTCVVGAPLNDVAGSDAGAAYVFTRSGMVWTQQARLDTAGLAADDFLGFSVALDGTTAVCGGIQDNVDGDGGAWVFQGAGSAWTETAHLAASDGAADDWFGYSAGTSGGVHVVGAQQADGAAAGSGSAYVFGASAYWTARCFCDAGNATCGNPYDLGGCANSTGVGALITATGSGSVAQQGADPLVLHVQQARPDKNCVWLQGAGASIQSSFRDGNLCVGNPTLRLPGFGCGPFPIGTLDATGALSTDDATYGFDVLAAALCKGDDIGAAAPTQREYQLWFRDGMGPCGTGSNLSNSIVVSWTP